MPDTGAPWVFPYPASTDDVRPYDDIQALAVAAAAALTAKLITNMASQTNTDATSRTTGSTTFTTTLSPANICGLSFTAPASGKVMVNWRCTLANTGNNYTACAPEVRLGASIGAGTVFLAVNDDRTVSTDSTTFEGQGASTLVTGLSPGTVYNVALNHRVVGGTGTFLRREVAVVPLLG
jgi:hypothetical protein